MIQDRGFTYYTPEEAVREKIVEPCPGLKELQRRAKTESKCEVCGQPAWKIADTGLCFSCTTGEAEPDDEVELL